jgi:hypothetical protein
MAFKGTFSGDNLSHVAAAGAGALVVGYFQSTGTTFGLGTNIRDLLTVVVGAVMAHSDGSMFKSFGLGVAAVGVASLVRNNLAVPATG